MRVRLGQTGSTTAADCRCGKLNGRHADILATILAKMSVFGVVVGVRVGVGTLEFQLHDSRGMKRMQ